MVNRETFQIMIKQCSCKADQMQYLEHSVFMYNI
jgi:hypothetical protein